MLTSNDNVSVLEKGLKKNFREVDVDVVDCPDLTQQPFTLANKGILFAFPFSH